MAENKQIDFVIVGGQKCGTTSLAGQLSQLSSVCFCSEKEPHFFSKTTISSESLSSYFDLYNAQPGQIIGEASTTYSFIDEYPDTPKRLFEHNPKMKIIFMLRDPVARIESHFNHRLRNGTITNSPINSVGNHACFIERSLYFRQLKAYQAYFPEAQIKVVFFEDYIKAPYAFLIEAADFLDITVPAESDINLQAQNVSDASLKFANKPLMKLLFKVVEKMPFAYKFSRILPIKIRFPHALKRLLWQKVEYDVKQLEKQTGVSCQRWRDKYTFSSSDRIQ